MIHFDSIRLTCLLFVLIVTSPHCHIVDTCAALAERVEHWLKQSKWVGLTLILWWLTFLYTIWVDVAFVHYSENCRILKLSSLFSFHIIYLLLLSNSWSKLSLIIIESTYLYTSDLVAKNEVTQIVQSETYYLSISKVCRSSFRSL